MSLLTEIETEIQEASYEAFFYIGQRLLEIRRDRLYEQENFKSWSAYCSSGRLEFTKQHADRLIRSSELRPKLPDMEPIGSNSGEWLPEQMRELAKCETDNDAKRVARKAISHAKKTGERVTAKLISQIRDGAEETGKADKNRKAKLESAALEKHLDKLSAMLMNWRLSLEKVDLKAWEDVPEEVLIRVRTEAQNLTSFLRT